MITAPINGCEQAEPYVLIREWETYWLCSLQGAFLQGDLFLVALIILLAYYLDCYELLGQGGVHFSKLAAVWRSPSDERKVHCHEVGCCWIQLGHEISNAQKDACSKSEWLLIFGLHSPRVTFGPPW